MMQKSHKVQGQFMIFKASQGSHGDCIKRWACRAILVAVQLILPFSKFAEHSKVMIKQTAAVNTLNHKWHLKVT